MGAVLSQLQDDKERVYAYAASALSKPKRNYSTTRKELLALMCVCVGGGGWGGGQSTLKPTVWGGNSKPEQTIMHYTG